MIAAGYRETYIFTEMSYRAWWFAFCTETQALVVGFEVCQEITPAIGEASPCPVRDYVWKAQKEETGDSLIGFFPLIHRTYE